jgi:hypothetical protein
MVGAIHQDSNGKHSHGFARFAGSGIAGLCELSLFHPVDTVAKRLMNNKENFCKDNYQTILFQKASNDGAFAKYKSLFGGFGYGALYKVSQRIYKFGGQPVLNDILSKHVFKSTSHDGTLSRSNKFWSNAVSGAILGAFEVVLLPFDTMKIKTQTNPELCKCGLVGLIKQEGIGSLYAGASYTAARNVFGSFMLFGVNSYVKSVMSSDDPTKKPTLFHLTVSSTAGSVSSILISCPLDVVKTRIQSGSHAGLSGATIIKNMYHQEGVGGFFKGSIPKVAVVGPKLIFSFTLAQYLIGFFTERRG